ncbi:uncharacterized protein LOC131160363 [Malania oleifera]|uniref:uncharacterized protein LOC131160363 n=1 Tax=Malania oleifera TaxID=397392 RepID=UPI0025AE8760|nr:uncharacterized protein LOC131160363 [Malania oleifera]
MSLLGNTIRSSMLRGIIKPNASLPSLLRQSPRSFSTEAEHPQGSPIDPFLQTPSTGLVYGRLVGITKYTLKTDIINMLEGCNLSIEDVKVDYNRSYAPVNMMLQFCSRDAYDTAIRTINRRDRLYRLERADRSQWDMLTPYDGKYLLLLGIPRNALQDDVERFLSGCEFDASSIQMFVRPMFPDSIRLALVRFPSQIQAMSAFIMKNRHFCLNNQILVRVLQ